MRARGRASGWGRAVLHIIISLGLTGCASAVRVQFPVEMRSGDVLADAMRPCQDFERAHGNFAVAGELSVQGSSAGGHISTQLRLSLDNDANRLRLEPIQEWPPAFTFIAKRVPDERNAAAQIDANLVLPRRGAIQQGRSRDLLRGLLGVPLSANEFVEVVIGCPMFGGGSLNQYALGPDTVRVVVEATVPSELFFARDAAVPGGWRVLRVGRTLPGQTWHWRADYGRAVVGPFRNFRIRSHEWNGILGSAFDVRFVWRRIQTASMLDQQLFVPEAALQPPAFVK